MKTPIERHEIKSGDLIRWEDPDAAAGALSAVEYTACYDEHGQFSNGQHYLLDRPEAAIELPTTPTFGVLRWDLSGDGSDPCVREGRWFVRDGDVFEANVNGTSTNTILAEDVNSFERVYVLPDATTAVPTEALDDLRRRFTAVGRMTYPVDRRQHAEDALRIFLAAVDAANEAHS